MTWISVKDKDPEDDQTVFVINSKVQMLPIKAYYCTEWNEFMSLENGDGTNHPLSITDWMPLPIRPEKEKNDYSKNNTEMMAQCIMKILRK